MTAAARYQFVWWWHPKYWSVAFHRLNEESQKRSGLGAIFCWFLWLGPLEIRRWR